MAASGVVGSTGSTFSTDRQLQISEREDHGCSRFQFCF